MSKVMEMLANWTGTYLVMSVIYTIWTGSLFIGGKDKHTIAS
jgi:hypothetical protein